MTQLTKRSKEKELIDLGEDFYTPHEYEESLKILFTVSKLFGFFKTTIKILKQFPPETVLVDVGCGGGLFLLNVAKTFPDMHLTGLDTSAEAIKLAQKELDHWQQKNGKVNVQFQRQLQPELDIEQKRVDVILLNLVCHHIEDNELVAFLAKANQIARKALIINDLQRNFFAYWLYKISSPIFFHNRLITHDGLISIQRSFTKKELKSILQQANIKNYKIKWHFPFRWSVLILKNNRD